MFKNFNGLRVFVGVDYTLEGATIKPLYLWETAGIPWSVRIDYDKR